jgi:hypothetical protein
MEHNRAVRKRPSAVRFSQATIELAQLDLLGFAFRFLLLRLDLTLGFGFRGVFHLDA